MKLRLSLCFALSSLVIPSLGESAAAQQPSSEHSMPTLRGQVQDILLPVTVIDKKGALVKDLTAKDLTLTQDGRPQVIKSLTTESTLPFRLGLLVDTSRSVYSAIDSERKATEKFLELMLPADAKPGGQNSEAFLIHFDREVELLEDFTGSRDKLNHEIDEMTPTSPGKDSPQGPETTGDDREASQSHFGRNGTQLYDAIYLASDELMKSKSGRKALVVFSDGVDRGSKETLNDAVDAADRAGLEVCTIYFRGEPERQEPGFPTQRRGGMGGSYPGSPGWPGGNGGGGNPRSGGRDENKQQADGKKVMQQIAQRTGGMFFEAKKRDNLEEIYSLIAAGLQQQYILTYAPDKADTDGEFHKIALKANNADYTVETREGYYVPSAER